MVCVQVYVTNQINTRKDVEIVVQMSYVKIYVKHVLMHCRKIIKWSCLCRNVKEAVNGGC